MNWLSVAVIALASISFYVGAWHMFFCLRVRERREILAFAVTCFIVGIYDLVSAGLYNVSSAVEGVFWQRWQGIVLTGLGICILWFVSDFIDRKSRSWDLLFYGCWIVQAFILLFNRSALTWTDTPSIKSFKVFNRIFVTYYEMEPGILFTTQCLLGLITGLYIVISLIRYYRAGNQEKTRPILIGVACLVAGVINDAAVNNELYEFFYVIEYSFMCVVLGMAYSLTTTHIQIRSALRLSREELLRLVAAVNEAAESIVITDTQGMIQYVNPFFEKVTHFTRDDSIGKTMRIVKSGKHDEAFYRELWDTISGGSVWYGRFTNRKKDGTLFEEEAVISPVRDSTGKIVNYVAVKRDVTHERALENQLRHSQKMEALGRLAGKIAHDFTNMLAVIFGHARFLETELGTKPEVHEHIKEIIKSIREAGILTGELLAFARKNPVSLQVWDLNKVVRGMEQMLKKTIGRDLELIIHTADQPIIVNVDRDQMEQVIVHIAINASDAMPHGGVLTIDTSVVNFLKEEAVQIQETVNEHKRITRKFAVLRMSDSGCGMTEEVKSHIFDPFFTTKERKLTTGLGLSTAYGIIQQHDEYINVYSNLGIGTTFTIYLPLTDQTEGEIEDVNEIEISRSNETVLVVESDTLLRGVLVRILHKLQYAILEAETSSQAMDLARECKGAIHLLITNVIIQRQGPNGKKLADGIKEVHPEIKVIFTSGYPTHFLVRRGLLTEEDTAVSAPFCEKNVAGAIHQLVRE